MIRKYIKKNRLARQLHDAIYSKYWSYRTSLLEKIRTLWFPFTVHCLKGPQDIHVDRNELIVVCLVRDGEPYIEEFINHYRSLGAEHIVFLDNGSTDNTIPIARSYDVTTILYTDSDFAYYETIMKRYLISRYSNGNWVLHVDIDEFFDYPYSRAIGLHSFLTYLSECDFNAVPLQMLDMFPKGSITQSNASASLRDTHIYYDISNISKHDYETNAWLHNNSISNPKIKTHRGGIRQKVFDMAPERPLLTKHSLLRLVDGLRAQDWRLHHIDNASIADVSCVLYHYKFNSRFAEYVARHVDRGLYTDEYSQYLRALDRESISFMDQGAKRLQSTDELIDPGFIEVSDKYTSFVRNKLR